MLDILRSIANSSDLFPHLKTPQILCDEGDGRPATHDLFMVDEDGNTYSTQLCDTHAVETWTEDYEDRGNPNN